MLFISCIVKYSTAACLGNQANQTYPGSAPWPIKIWKENLFTGQVMRILLEDVFDQHVEFFDDSTEFAEVWTTIMRSDEGTEKTDPAFRNLISEVSLTVLRRTWNSSCELLVLPLGYGAPADYYKVIHPNLGLHLPYISHLLTLVSFASDDIDESYFVSYNSADEAYSASCEWLQNKTDLLTFWVPEIKYKEIDFVLLYFIGTSLIIISVISFFILWLLLRGLDDIKDSFHHRLPTIEKLCSSETAKKWIKAGDVASLSLICLGCLMSGSLVFLVRRRTDWECAMIPFVMHGGVLFVIGSLTVRTDKLVRIYKMARGQSIRYKISFWNTWFVWVFLPFAVVFMFVILCAMLIPLSSTWFVYGDSFYRECVLSERMFAETRDWFISTEKLIFGIPIIFEGFLLIRLMHHLLSLDGLEDQYHEHAQVLCVILTLGIILAVICIVEVISMNPYTKDTFQFVMLLWWYFFVQAFMFGPRLYRASCNRDIEDDFLRESFMQKICSEEQTPSRVELTGLPIIAEREYKSDEESLVTMDEDSVLEIKCGVVKNPKGGSKVVF